jgi:hypothetical protein
MEIVSNFYRAFGRRFSTLLLFSVGGSIVLDAYLNQFGQFVWDYHNAGKLWKDIKHKYSEVAEE